MASIVLKGSGAKMPLVGFGCWKVTKDTCADTIYHAIKAGYRLFDSACDYGNEKESGEGLKRALDDGIVKREEIFITSKLWHNFHAKEHVHQIAKKQLADWQLDYFDLFLIHFPISLEYIDPKIKYPPGWFGTDDKTVHIGNVPIQETWQAMEELVDHGLVKDIGVSNFSGAILLDVLRYNKKPVSVLQIEHHPYLTQEPLVSLCKELGIAITGYCSFGPQSWVELGMAGGAVSLLTSETIKSIAAATGKTPAQVLLRWATQRGIAVIPKSNNHDRLIQNLQCTDFNLSEEHLKAISALNINFRFNDPSNMHPKFAIFA